MSGRALNDSFGHLRLLSVLAQTVLVLATADLLGQELLHIDVIPTNGDAALGIFGIVAVLAAVVLEFRLSRLAKRQAADSVELSTRRGNDETTRAATDAKRRRVQRVLMGEEPLVMAFQPIVNIRSGAVMGHEALARFEGGGPPDERFAEAWSVSAELGMELETRAVALSLAAVDTMPGYISLNMSPQTLLSPKFWALMNDCDGPRIVIELTEHVHISEYAIYQGALGALRRLGIRTAVDDAGAGYAGLRHILALAPEVIKVDRSIVEHVADDPATKDMLSALLAFSRATGGVVIAEGVETETQAQALMQLGIRYGQGYLFGYPQPLASTAPRLTLVPIAQVS